LIGRWVDSCSLNFDDRFKLDFLRTRRRVGKCITGPVGMGTSACSVDGLTAAVSILMIGSSLITCVLVDGLASAGAASILGSGSRLIHCVVVLVDVDTSAALG
jgi:hypothetical protein